MRMYSLPMAIAIAEPDEREREVQRRELARPTSAHVETGRRTPAWIRSPNARKRCRWPSCRRISRSWLTGKTAPAASYS